MMRCLITDCRGFVGRALTSYSRAQGYDVRLALHWPKAADRTFGTGFVAVGSLSSETDWTSALKDVAHVVHFAARVHVMNDKSADPLAEFRRVNIDGTVNRGSPKRCSWRTLPCLPELHQGQW
jgi:nucleoside-diphosphate-sugar epimerase